MAASAAAQTAPAAPAAPAAPVAPVAPVAPDASQTTTTTTESKVLEVKTLAPDLLVMSAGSVLVVRGKQTSRLESEVRLADGSVLTPGGTVRRPDGSSTMLSDKQAISATGKISEAPPGSVTETTNTGIEIVPTTKP